MKNVSHTEYMNTHFRQYVSCCAYSNFYDICTVCDTLYKNTALSCQDVDALSLSKPSVDAIPNQSRHNGSPNNHVQLSRTRREEGEEKEDKGRHWLSCASCLLTVEETCCFLYDDWYDFY